MDNNNGIKQQIRLPKWAIAVISLSVLLNFLIYNDLKALRQEINHLRNNISHIESTISNTMSSGIYQMNNVLKQEASMVSEFQYEFGDPEDKKADILLSVKPKAVTVGEKIFFLCKVGNNSPFLLQAESSDNIIFTAKTNISIFDSVELDLIIENGSTKRSEKLQTVPRLADKITARLNPEISSGSMSYDKQKQELVINYTFDLLDSGSRDIRYDLSDVNLVVEINGKVLEEMPMIKEEKGFPFDRYHIQLKNYIIPCKEDDDVKIYITAKDDRDFNYKCHLERWGIDSRGMYPNEHGFGEIEVY